MHQHSGPIGEAHWLQPEVGHYGVFNGSRFRAEIVPRISDFVLSNNARPWPQRQQAARARKPAAGNGSGQSRRAETVETVGE